MSNINYKGNDTLDFFLLLNIEYPDVNKASETRVLYTVRGVKNHRKFINTAIDILVDKRLDDLYRVAKLVGYECYEDLAENTATVSHFAKTNMLLGFVLDDDAFSTSFVGRKYTYTIHAIPTHEAGI